jgi:hypothetical protein
MAILYHDAREDRLTLRRIDAEKRRLAKEYEDQHGRPPTPGELANLVWNSKMEPGNGHPNLPIDDELYEEKA